MDVNTVGPDPIRQFQRWMDAAFAANLPLPNAMTLATATPDGKPSARTVLLKQSDEAGFVFFTNYTSRKGKELFQNPRAVLVFSWIELERQVRIDGVAEKVSAVESDAYFQTRPRESQISAVISPQSKPVASREELEQKAAALEEEYKGRSIPRPSHWGGFRVRPEQIEFWQGREARLHDRILYVRQKDGIWKVSRLAP